MELAILAVSGDPVLQEEIRTCLEQFEGCELVTATTKAEALMLAGSTEFNAVLIDASENDIPLVRFAHELVAEHGNIRLLVIPPGNNPHHPVLKGLVFTSLIVRPIEVADIRAGLGFESPENEGDIAGSLIEEDAWYPQNFIEGSEGQELDPDIDIPDWLEDVGTGLNELGIEETVFPVPDQKDISAAWEQEDSDPLPPPLPLIDNPHEEMSEQLKSENQALPDDLHTAVTTRLDPGMLEQALENVAVLSTEVVESSGVETEIVTDTFQEPPLEILDFSGEKSEDQVGTPSPRELAPGTEPLGIQGVRLKYFVVLIPRLPNHFLARELSDRLGFILPQFHLTLGWKLTGISVRPTHLLWQFSLPANVNPVDAVSQIRRKTSTHIFTNFPKVAAENMSNDFWAAGYLILSGDKPPSLPTIREFIQRTRQ